MWIRSQDKTRIKKIRGCRILGSNNGYLVEAFDRTGDIVGIYSTKEKALKVLDKIVEEINYGDLQNVFVMPQNDEVEDE